MKYDEIKGNKRKRVNIEETMSFIERKLLSFSTVTLKQKIMKCCWMSGNRNCCSRQEKCPWPIIPLTHTHFVFSLFYKGTIHIVNYGKIPHTIRFDSCLKPLELSDTKRSPCGHAAFSFCPTEPTPDDGDAHAAFWEMNCFSCIYIISSPVMLLWLTCHEYRHEADLSVSLLYHVGWGNLRWSTQHCTEGQISQYTHTHTEHTHTAARNVNISCIHTNEHAHAHNHIRLHCRNGRKGKG